MSLSESDDRCVRGAQAKVGVALDQLADARPVGAAKSVDDESTLGDIGDQRRFSGWADLASDQEGRLGDDQASGDQRADRALEERLAGLVVRVVTIRCGDQRPGVDDEHEPSVASEPVGGQELICVSGAASTPSGRTDA